MAKDIISLVFYEISEARPLYLFKLWAEDSYLEDCNSLSSQQISNLLEKIGSMEEERERFFWKWIKMQGEIKAIIFDITSISSYSKFIESLEWGYNRDGENLPQINFGIIVGGDSELPLSYRIYPGSIPDVSTLKNILNHLKSFGLKEYLFVLDRGFYSETNIAEMDREGIGFILPMPLGRKIAGALISKNKKALSSPLSGFYLQKHALFHVKRGVKVSGISVQAHLYLDEKRRAEEIEGLMRKLVEIEDGVRGRRFLRGGDQRFLRGEEVERFIEERIKGGKKLFSIRVRDGKAKLVRKEKVLSRLMERMGKMIIITNREGLGREEILLLYRRKDRIEKLFDVMRTRVLNF
ncbi:MAG: IS1634 family transposase [candidate division WOR-3 bacterium]